MNRQLLIATLLAATALTSAQAYAAGVTSVSSEEDSRYNMINTTLIQATNPSHVTTIAPTASINHNLMQVSISGGANNRVETGLGASYLTNPGNPNYPAIPDKAPKNITGNKFYATINNSANNLFTTYSGSYVTNNTIRSESTHSFSASIETAIEGYASGSANLNQITSTLKDALVYSDIQTFITGNASSNTVINNVSGSATNIIHSAIGDYNAAPSRLGQYAKPQSSLATNGNQISNTISNAGSTYFNYNVIYTKLNNGSSNNKFTNKITNGFANLITVGTGISIGDDSFHTMDFRSNPVAIKNNVVNATVTGGEFNQLEAQILGNDNAVNLTANSAGYGATGWDDLGNYMKADITGNNNAVSMVATGKNNVAKVLINGSNNYAFNGSVTVAGNTIEQTGIGNQAYYTANGNNIKMGGIIQTVGDNYASVTANCPAGCTVAKITQSGGANTTVTMNVPK